MVYYKGKQYKGIPFTVLKEKLLSKEKKQTMRMIYMPSYAENDIVAIVWKEKGEKPEALYLVMVLWIIFKKLKDIDKYDAQKDGFNSIEECQKKLLELNKGKTLEHYVAITTWEEFP